MMKMKKLLLITLLFVPFFGIAQDSRTEHLNFTVDNNQDLVWQKIYESDVTLDELKTYFLNESFTSELKLNETKFSGQSKGKKIGTSKTSQWRTLGANLFYEAFVSVEVKGGRYRVTLTDLKFSAVQKYNLWAGGMQNQSSTFEEYFISRRRGGFKKPAVVKNSLTLYDKEFDNIFTLKENELKEDW